MLISYKVTWIDNTSKEKKESKLFSNMRELVLSLLMQRDGIDNAYIPSIRVIQVMTETKITEIEL